MFFLHGLCGGVPNLEPRRIGSRLLQAVWAGTTGSRVRAGGGGGAHRKFLVGDWEEGEDQILDRKPRLFSHRLFS